jgi:dephospho-CoA kinase
MSKARVPVIGVVGGIGSGKSEVARALGRLGCVVADSDALAREILTRPAVRDELVAWWGAGVLGADGQVDRAAVARIVFNDPWARRRLEGLVHPLIHAERRELIDRVAREGAGTVPAVVVDAPLLFEAGVDRECDAVIFVEAPWEVRLERVKRTRGWDAAELERREAAQMPLEEKRRRSGFVVDNGGSRADVDGRARQVLERVRAAMESRVEGEG